MIMDAEWAKPFARTAGLSRGRREATTGFVPRQEGVSSSAASVRPCFSPPPLAVHESARQLDAAVSAHLAGQHLVAADLIRAADRPGILAWADTMWGTGGPWSGPRSTPDIPVANRLKPRMPGTAAKMAIIHRDGFTCRFCGAPVILPDARKALMRHYPEAARWGVTNASRHTALQVLELQWDHILPHARGGSSDPSNILVTCAPCNYGRGNLTCEEVGLSDPWLRPPVKSDWDGLSRLLKQAVGNV